jgi:hypothetical protein
MNAATDPTRQFLRHTVATLAYRGGKVLRDAPDSFALFRVGETTRTPSQILAHIGDLLDWALSQATGNEQWNDATPLPWQHEVERFYDAVNALDTFLASDVALGRPCEQIFQGPVTDGLAHFGQLAMLRRLAGHPVRGENYAVAEIERGRVGPQQSANRMEFDRENATGRILFVG